MRWLPAARVNRFATWSFHFSYFFTPSIQTSRRWMPAGELPLPLTSTGDVTLALLAGPQIFAARFADEGGAQLVNALVLMPTIIDSSSGPPSVTTRSWRESRFRSRAMICNILSGPERLMDLFVNVELPAPCS